MKHKLLCGCELEVYDDMFDGFVFCKAHSYTWILLTALEALATCQCDEPQCEHQQAALRLVRELKGM